MSDENEVQPDADAKRKDDAMDADEPSARPEKDRVLAYQAIIDFIGGDPFNTPAPTYQRTSPNPYRDDDSHLVEIYQDENGFEYWVNTADDSLVQAGPSARLRPEPRQTKPEDRLPVSLLREKAVAMVTRVIKDFPERRSSFHPLEDNRKRETYFFRWDDFSFPAPESELPPFVQVGLHADGTLASFVNTMGFVHEKKIHEVTAHDSYTVDLHFNGERMSLEVRMPMSQYAEAIKAVPLAGPVPQGLEHTGSASAKLRRLADMIDSFE